MKGLNNYRIISYTTVIFCSLYILACGDGQRQEAKQVDANADEMAIPEVDKETEVVLTEGMKAGNVIYDQYCATCHQSNGGGVPNLNPPLKGTDYVTGDKERLIRIVLKGSNVGLEVNGAFYSNAMPANDFLSDEDIANVLSYIRNSFGNRADTVSATEVGAVRASG